MQSPAEFLRPAKHAQYAQDLAACRAIATEECGNCEECQDRYSNVVGAGITNGSNNGYLIC